MTIYIVRWSENDAKKHSASSSYSTAVKLFKSLTEQSKNVGGITIESLDEAIEKVTLNKKPEYIELLNRL